MRIKKLTIKFVNLILWKSIILIKLIIRIWGHWICLILSSIYFSLNILMMLQHRLPATAIEPSALYMHYPDGSEERLQLQPGEVVIFLAGTQAHSRTRIAAQESVSILTFGFMPKGAPIENYRR